MQQINKNSYRISCIRQGMSVWFITGASKGLGKALAEHALKKGIKVVAGARSADKLEKLCEPYPNNALPVELDVARAESIQSAVQKAMNKFGRIDVLINNAGFNLIGAVEESTEEQIRQLFDVNFFGALAMTRQVLPIMRAQKSGTIVQVSSVQGSMPFPGYGVYGATKFALEGVSEALQQEVAPFGIRVIIVKPGAFRTEILDPQGTLTFTPGLVDYENSPTHPATQTKVQAAQFHGTQPGDPDRAAAVIAHVLGVEQPPLRLLLGSDCVEAVLLHDEKQLAEYRAWESLSRSTDYPK